MPELSSEQSAHTRRHTTEASHLPTLVPTFIGICSEAQIAQCGLLAERQSSALREQFIAVLGHDLRNPLSAIVAGMAVLSRGPLDERQTVVAKLVGDSAARMSALIDDLMDFARGRLGNGMSLIRGSVCLEPVLRQVIDELQLSQPGRVLTTQINLPRLINCDVSRVAQLLSNLVANALTHGSADGTVTIDVHCKDGVFEMSVANAGEPIAAAAIARLFQPFTRDEIRPSHQGLGLGLYIASEIARAHEGALTATSDDSETRFTFRMPVLAGNFTVQESLGIPLEAVSIPYAASHAVSA